MGWHPKKTQWASRSDRATNLLRTEKHMTASLDFDSSTHCNGHIIIYYSVSCSHKQYYHVFLCFLRCWILFLEVCKIYSGIIDQHIKGATPTSPNSSFSTSLLILKMKQSFFLFTLSIACTYTNKPWHSAFLLLNMTYLVFPMKIFNPHLPPQSAVLFRGPTAFDYSSFYSFIF